MSDDIIEDIEDYEVVLQEAAANAVPLGVIAVLDVNYGAGAFGEDGDPLFVLNVLGFRADGDVTPVTFALAFDPEQAIYLGLLDEDDAERLVQEVREGQQALATTTTTTEDNNQ